MCLSVLVWGKTKNRIRSDQRGNTWKFREHSNASYNSKLGGRKLRRSRRRRICREPMLKWEKGQDGRWPLATWNRHLWNSIVWYWIVYMLPGDVKQTTSKCSRRSLSPPELSNFSPLIGFWSDSFDSSSEYGSSRKALKIFTGGRNVSSEIFCVVLPETNGCLTKCRLDLQPPWLGPPYPPTPPHHPHPHPGRSHSHPHQKTKSINSKPLSSSPTSVCLWACCWPFYPRTQSTLWNRLHHYRLVLGAAYSLPSSKWTILCFLDMPCKVAILPVIAPLKTLNVSLNGPEESCCVNMLRRRAKEVKSPNLKD